MSDFATMKLVCGDTEISLLDRPYELAANGYAPRIASRSEGFLGGRGIYNDVPTEIVINIHGDTPAEVYGAQNELVEMLDRADRWAQRVSSEPVVMHVQMQHSLLPAPLQALVVGKDGDDLLTLGANYSDRLLIYEVEGAAVRFRRRGQLLGQSETASSAATIAVPEIGQALPINPTAVPSPTMVELLGLGDGDELIGSGFLVITGEPVQGQSGTNFGLYAAADMTSSEFASSDDSANAAYGDNIMEIDASVDQTGEIEITANAAYADVLVYVAVRNDSTTTEWQVRAKSTGFLETATRWEVIGATSQQPQVIELGTLRSVAEFHETIALEFRTTASTGTLGVNYIAVVPLTDETHAIRIQGGSYTSVARPYDLVIDPRALSHDRALAYLRASS